MGYVVFYVIVVWYYVDCWSENNVRFCFLGDGGSCWWIYIFCVELK